MSNVRPGQPAYVTQSCNEADLRGRFVVVDRAYDGKEFVVDKGPLRLLIVPLTKDLQWWCRAATAGDTLPLQGFNLKERPIPDAYLRPLTPPDQPAETTDTSITNHQELTV